MNKIEKNREGVSMVKASHLLGVLFRGKTREADAYLEKFADFNVSRLQGLTRKKS